MLIAGLLLFSTSLLNVKPSPVIANVTIGARGAPTASSDTGSRTSFIDLTLAAELKLVPRFRVALKLNTRQIAQQRLAEAEVVFDGLAVARRLDPLVRGVLGLNALAGFNFTLSPGAGEFELAADRPPGESIPFVRVEVRIAIPARMGRETLSLILDSGATHVVLFRRPAAMAKSPAVVATFGTIDGARMVAPTSWTAEMSFTKAVRLGVLPAAIVTRTGTAVDGLLPISAFQRIYVDQSRGEVVLVPKT